MTKREGRTFWTDHQGDLIADEWWDDEHVMVAKSGRMYVPVYLPTEPADIDRMLSDLADAMGREWEGLRAKPQPPPLDEWVRSKLMPHVETHPRFGAMFTGDVVAEAFRVATTDPTVFADFVSFLPLLSFTPAEEVEQGASA